MKKSLRLRLAAIAAGLAGSSAAMAAAPAYDVTAAVAAITGGNVSIGELGVAALVMIVGMKVWKRLRGAA